MLTPGLYSAANSTIHNSATDLNDYLHRRDLSGYGNGCYRYCEVKTDWQYIRTRIIYGAFRIASLAAKCQDELFKLPVISRRIRDGTGRVN